MAIGRRVRHWWNVMPRLRWVIVALVVLLVAIRLALPSAVEAYVNHELNRSKSYGGRIGHVDLQLWRGQYRIHQLQIKKRTEGVTSPFFDADRLDLSVEWRELFHGSLVGQVIMHQPRLNFEVGPTPEQSQTGKEEHWNQLLERLFPFKINRLEIQDGEIHFRNPHRTPVVDIYLSKIAANATNLTNTRDVKKELPAGVGATATTIGGGGLNFQLQFNPLTDQPAYQLDTALTNVDASALNDFLRAYGKFDIQRGIFSLFTSVAGKGGTYDGYFKVFFRDLKVFSWKKDQNKDLLEIFWQAIVGGAASILKNQPKDTLAARVHISGSYAGSKVGIWGAVGTLLQNAFIQSLDPKLDEKMTVKDIEQGSEKGEKGGKHGGTNENREQRFPASAPGEKGAEKLLPSVVNSNAASQGTNIGGTYATNRVAQVTNSAAAAPEMVAPATNNPATNRPEQTEGLR